MNSRVAGPDFICVGMPKAGTGWLFDQLRYHPDFCVPEPVKRYLVDLFTDELRECTRLFGGQTREWAARYGL